MSESLSFLAIAAWRLLPNWTSTSVPIVREESREVGSPLGSSESRPGKSEIHKLPTSHTSKACGRAKQLKLSKRHEWRQSLFSRALHAFMTPFNCGSFSGASCNVRKLGACVSFSLHETGCIPPEDWIPGLLVPICRVGEATAYLEWMEQR